MAKSLTSTGGTTTAAGVGTLGNANSYWQGILSGNRAAINQAVAPEAASARSKADAAKRQLASSGTGRGGGAVATKQSINDQTRASLDNAIFGARPTAASESAKIGSEISRIGVAETGEGLQSAAIAGDTAKDIAGIAADSRVSSYKINQDMVAKASTAVDNVLAAFFG